MLNRQLVFDTAAAHLLTQRERATPDTKPPKPLIAGNPGLYYCSYRMQKEGRTLKCAIGALIPDERYNPNAEGIVASSSRVHNSFDARFGVFQEEIISGLSERNDSEFITKLQKIHDLAGPIEEWPQRLADFAREWGLDPAAAHAEYPFNRQLAFDRVARHLLTQNAKATDGIPDDVFASCCYRTRLGLKCAIGALIPDEKYQEDFEGGALGARPDILRCLDPDLGLPSKVSDLGFLRSLQRIHDGRLVQQWSKELTEFAELAGLSDAVVKELRPNG